MADAPIYNSTRTMTIDGLESRLRALEQRTPLATWAGEVREVAPLGRASSFCASATDARKWYAYLGTTIQSNRLMQLEPAELERYLVLDHYPIPAPELREGYWGSNHFVYWLSGLSDYLVLSDFLVDDPVTTTTGCRVLDFGCSSGRVLRHFASYRSDLELLGNDLDASSLAWIRRYLPTSLLTFLNPLHPPLPLPDSSVDFAYGFSVFTHIDQFEESWLLELRRVLKTGGRLFLTISTERNWQLLADPEHFMSKTLLRWPHAVVGRPDLMVNQELLQKPMPQSRVVLLDPSNPLKCQFAFHSVDYVRERWGRMFEIEQIIPRAHGEHQDGVLARKR